jgi:hypothetical protein
MVDGIFPGGQSERAFVLFVAVIKLVRKSDGAIKMTGEFEPRLGIRLACSRDPDRIKASIPSAVFVGHDLENDRNSLADLSETRHRSSTGSFTNGFTFEN